MWYTLNMNINKNVYYIEIQKRIDFKYIGGTLLQKKKKLNHFIMFEIFVHYWFIKSMYFIWLKK